MKQGAKDTLRIFGFTFVLILLLDIPLFLTNHDSRFLLIPCLVAAWIAFGVIVGLIKLFRLCE